MIASPFRRGALVIALLAALSAPAAAQTFKASAVDAKASITDGLAQVTFKIEVINDSSESAMINLVVVFEDGTEVNVGDVEPETTVTSEQQSRTIDVSASSSQAVVMNVTLKYSLGGENFETPWILSVLAQ
jgi:protein-disulfide isomerase